MKQHDHCQASTADLLYCRVQSFSKGQPERRLTSPLDSLQKTSKVLLVMAYSQIRFHPKQIHIDRDIIQIRDQRCWTDQMRLLVGRKRCCKGDTGVGSNVRCGFCCRSIQSHRLVSAVYSCLIRVPQAKASPTCFDRDMTSQIRVLKESLQKHLLLKSILYDTKELKRHG